MPTSSFSRQITVSADPERCWETITDVARVTSWVTIVKDVETLEHLARYEALLEDRLGPFRLRADLDIAVTDVENGRSLHVTAEGEDRQVSSQIKVEADLRLQPAERGTIIAVDGSYEVAGRVATLGASMITTKAQKIMNEFFENAERDLS